MNASRVLLNSSETLVIIMRNSRVFILLSAAVLFGASVSTHGQTVSGSLSGGKVAKGRSARGTIVLSIPAGLHVNSNRPSSPYAIPTTVKLSGAGVRVAGPTFPRGRDRKFGFSDIAINVYEGTVAFPFTVTVPARFKGDTVRVRAVVRFQACNDEVCYPPRTKEIMITARVR